MSYPRLRSVVLLSAFLIMLLLASAPSAFARSLHSNFPLGCPSITSFTPSSGAPGTPVTLTGCGFTGSTSVTFHGVVASFVVNSDTQITAMVPVGATSGVIAVYTPTKTVKSPGKFIVLKASASITLSPTVGPPTSSITVTGSGFSKNKAVDVYFDTSDEALAGTDGQGAFSITITVPADAVPGTHTVSAVQRYTGLTAQASFLVQTNWDEFGYNLQHSGTNPYENVLNPSNVSGLGLDWTAATGDDVASVPAVVNGVVYVGSYDDNLYAFNAQTGAELWKAATGSLVLSSPAVANGVVYVGSIDGNLYAFNAQTGSELWFAATGNSIYSSPAVANGVVYIGSSDDNLYAYALPIQHRAQPPARPNPAQLHPNLKLRPQS